MKLLRSLSLLVAITCVVWIAVLWRWQAADQDESLDDIALYLVALPLTLFVLVLAGRWAFTGVDERAAKRLAASSPAASQTPVAITAGEAELMATMHLLAAAVNCAAGATAQAVGGALGGHRPGLDAHLRDDDGLPVMAARIEGLDVDALSPPLGIAENLAKRRDPAWGSMAASPSIARALAALAPCLDTVFAALVPWRERLGIAVGDASGDNESAHRSNASSNASSSGDQPGAPRTPAGLPIAGALPARVLLYVAWVPDASPYDRAVADLWLQRAIDERRQGIVAAGRIVRPPVEPASSGAALLRQADEAMVRMRRESAATNDLVLLIAAESHIADATVQRWQRDGLLCSSSRPKGRIPGEAAAALLLAPLAWAHDGDEPAAVLHRPPVGARDKSVDAAGRIDAAVASSMAEQAITVAGLEPAAIAAIVSDADQTTPRALETHAAVQRLLPHLDPADDIAFSGVACGHVGAPSTLIAIALAAQRALDDHKPCLALSVGDPLARAAIVARPPLPASESASAPQVSPASSPAAPRSAAA